MLRRTDAEKLIAVKVEPSCLAGINPLLTSWVTYRDPKRGSQDPAGVVAAVVKDRFSAWLADREEVGQVIVQENEESDAAPKQRLPYTKVRRIWPCVGAQGLLSQPGTPLGFLAVPAQARHSRQDFLAEHSNVRHFVFGGLKQ